MAQQPPASTPATEDAAAATPAPPPPPPPPPLIREVRLDGLVASKVIKHCHESFPMTVTGQLLGMDVKDTLQVTNCYPFPQRDSSLFHSEQRHRDGGEQQLDHSQYQVNMMRCVREVNIDHQVVGWYQSTGSQMGSFLTPQWIDTQFFYQDQLRNVVCLIYDPVLSPEGTMNVKAYRLTEAFMRLQKQGSFSSLSFSRAHVNSSEIIEQLPVRLHASSVQRAFIARICREEDGRHAAAGDVDAARLSLPLTPIVEPTLEYMVNDLDEINREQSRYSYFVRNNFARINTVHRELVKKRRAAGRDGDVNTTEEEAALGSMLSAESSRLESRLQFKELHDYTAMITTQATSNAVKQNAIATLRGAGGGGVAAAAAVDSLLGGGAE